MAFTLPPTLTSGTPRLDFERGRFVLSGMDERTNIRLSKNPYWACGAPGCYETVSLKAAAAFRHRASPYVERIFKRTFQAHYDLPRSPPLPPELDAHQLEGVQWVLERKRSYLAHAPGAGKTAQAIVAACVALAQSPGRALFIVPPSLMTNWVKEIWKVTGWMGVWPTIGAVPLSADQDDMAWRAEFILCPDSMLAKPWVYERLRSFRFKLIAVDEASRFKDPFAERSLAFYGGRIEDRAYPGLFHDARHVVFLDGSPMPNRPMELWAPTYALHPEAIDCMDQNDFGYRYCGARPNERGQWEYLHSSHEDELREKLQADFMHVVPESALAHPERRRSMVFTNECPLSAEHREWTRRNLPALVSQLDELGDEASQGDVARIRREVGIAKVPFVARYVAERLRGKNESILLFAWHRDVVDALTLRLDKWKPGMIKGGTDAADRDRYMAEFQAGTRRILIMNIAAGGRGHNLQRADRVIFAEWSWTDELNKQCEKRASRRGNEKAYTRCEYLVAPGTLDEPVLSSVFTKEKRVRRIIG